MSERWYKEAVIYCVEVETFQDSDGDGCGDLRGPDEPAGLPGPARRHLPVAQPDPPLAAPRRRLRRQPTTTASTRGSARSATSPSWPSRHASAASGSCSTSSSTTPPTSTRGSSPRAATPSRRTATGTSGATTEPPDRRQGIVFPGEQTETWTWDDDGRRVVLPPLLRLPARPELGQPGGARRDQEGHGVLAAARRLRLPHRRRAVRPRAGRAPDVDPGAAGLHASSTTGARTCSGASGDAVLLCEANVDADELAEVLHVRRRRPQRPRAHAVRLRAQPALWLALARAGRRAARRGAGAPARSCRPWRSGRRSCATTTSWTSAG